jgi:large conductance mechanosensitive channel protein
MAAHKGFDLGHFDGVIFANNIACQSAIKGTVALRADIRAVINDLVRIFMQDTAVPLMPRLRSARFGLLAARFAICRGRLRGRPRGLGRALQIQHDLYKLLLAQLLKGIPIHSLIDSEITKPRKGGVGNYVFAYGSFINAVINFLIVAFVVFLLVKMVNRIKAKAEKPAVAAPAAPAGPTEKDILIEIRDALKAR